jgi:hypothetical protein
VAFFLGMHEGAQQVIPGNPVQFLDLGRQIAAKRHGTVQPPLQLFRGDVGVKVGCHQRKIVTPLLDALAVSCGDADDLRDHQHGERHRKIPHKIHLSAPQACLEQRANPVLNGAGPLFDGGAQKGLLDQATNPRMVRFVALEHERR